MASTSKLYERHLTPALEAALDDTPVVLVVGPRQAGKTTLCRLVAERRGARLLSLDEAATLAAASADPAGFVAALEAPVVLDEIPKRIRDLEHFDGLTPARATTLADKYDLDYLVVDRPLALPVAYKNDRFWVYELGRF